MKKLFFFLLLVTAFTAKTFAATVTENVPVALTENTVFADQTVGATEDALTSYVGSSMAVPPAMLPKWLRSAIHWIAVVFTWLDETLPPAIVINNSNDGDSGAGQLKVDFANVDYAQAENLGMTITPVSINCTVEVVIFATEQKTVSVMPGNYPLNPEGIADVMYIIHDRR